MDRMISRLSPPSFKEQLLDNVFEVQTALAGLITGVIALLGVFTAYHVVDMRPWVSNVLVVVLAGAISLGGVMMLRGIFDRSDNLQRGWALERAGLILSGVAWLVYGIWAFAEEPQRPLGWLSPLLLVGAMSLQLYATVIDERRVRDTIGAGQ